MAYEVSDSVVIAAPPEKVWAVLTDLDGYPAWHPAYLSVSGQLSVGSVLTINTTSPSTGNPVKLKVTVTAVEPASELRRFLLRPADGGTELTQAGTYKYLGGSRGRGGARGALKTVGNLQDSYREIGEALKRQAEV
jgi:hypothetical protein